MPYDELVKQLRELPHLLFIQLHGHEDMIYKAADAIEELSKQNEKWEEAVKTALDFIPCWIPVTERLPEDGQDILAVQNVGGEVRIVPANYDRGVWYDCVFNRLAEHITHWMPLPEPPKEE